MNILSWCLALAFLVSTLAQAVSFHKATVCRQEAWLLSFEIKTKSLFTRAKSGQERWHPRCRLVARGSAAGVYWRELESARRHSFFLPLRGML